MRSAVPWNGGAQKRDLGGTQTRDTQNRNLMLYSTELRGHILYYRFAKVSNIFAMTKFSTQKKQCFYLIPSARKEEAHTA